MRDEDGGRDSEDWPSAHPTTMACVDGVDEQRGGARHGEQEGRPAPPAPPAPPEEKIFSSLFLAFVRVGWCGYFLTVRGAARTP